MAVFEIAMADKKKLRFLVCGVFNTAFGLCIFPLLYFTLRRFGIHYEIVLAISQLAAILFSFATNKFFVFRTKGNLLSEFFRFSAFHFVISFLNIAALPVLVESIGMHPVSAQFIFATIVIVCSYFWHSRVSFESHREVDPK